VVSREENAIDECGFTETVSPTGPAMTDVLLFGLRSHFRREPNKAYRGQERSNIRFVERFEVYPSKLEKFRRKFNFVHMHLNSVPP
jgi:hypothetical protein